MEEEKIEIGLELEPEPTLAELIADELRDNLEGLPYYRDLTPEEIAEIEDYNVRVATYNEGVPPEEQLPPYILPAQKLKSPNDLAYILLEGKDIPNPNPQQQVPTDGEKRAADLKSMFSPAALSSFADIVILKLQEAISSHTPKDFEMIKDWAKIGHARGKLDDTQLSAILNKIDEREDDSNWQPTIKSESRTVELWGIESLSVSIVQEAVSIVELPLPPIPGESLGPGV